MNRNKDNQLAFRVSEQAYEKFMTTLNAQNELLEKMGVSKMTKTYFFEKLIADEYLKYLNKQKDPETTERIDQRIDTRLELAIRNRDKFLKEILFENRKTNAMLKLLLEKQNINIHNTEVLESIENKSELEAVVDRLIAKEVFGKSNVLEVESKTKVSKNDEQNLSTDEIKTIMQDYFDDIESEI